jgi:hypothetical protein
MRESRFPFQRAKFWKKIYAGLISGIQFWENQTQDIFVSWKTFNSITELYFSFDGIENYRSCAIVAALCRFLFDRYPANYHNEHALVVEI